MSGSAVAGEFEWGNVTTECRDARASARGEELRCLVNRETIRNTVTGHAVTRVIIRHPGICVMVPFASAREIVLIRQYRYALGGELWELPAGTLTGREEGGRVIATESPERCAARELREETGYEAAQWDKVAAYYAMPGGSDEIVHVFFARGLRKGAPALDEGEVIREARAFGTAELEGMITRGDIRDAKSLVGLFYALARRPGGVRIV
jgi:ADP-ribose diphosphatase